MQPFTAVGSSFHSVSAATATMKLSVIVCVLIGTLLHLCQAAVYNAENYQNFRRKCAKILGTSAEIMQQIEGTKNFVSDSREMHCLVRCVGILSEFYDDETGTNWELVAQQVEGQDGFEEHRRATTECIEALPREEVQSDLCRKSYLSFRCAMKSAKQHIKDRN